ncbi:MAG: hypothetical protein IIB57_09450, partial [Planctomycetes bacterium]|nr:hypothetical protein [Planctomycetota bacterium]
DYTILEAEIEAAFFDTGSERGYVDFGAFTSLPEDLLIDSFKLRETGGHIYLFSVEVSGVCDDGLWCNGVETCDPDLGCQLGTPPDCGDGIPCSDDEGNYRPFDAHRILQGETDVVSVCSCDEMVLTPANPPQPNGWTTTGRKAWYLPAIFSGLGTRPFARSELDLTPPAPVGDRIGHYFLPHCLSFKVEWALDPRDPAIAGRLDSERRILWFDPADPDGQLASLKEALQDVKDADDDPQREDDLEYLLCNPLFGRDPASGVVANTERYSLWCRFEEQCPEDLCGGSCGGSCPPEGWDEVPDPPRRNFVVFGATRRMPVDPVTGAGGELVAEDVFPVALRITVDVIDARRRLERPIRKVMVIPIGG